jgi:hypothetical protein
MASEFNITFRTDNSEWGEGKGARLSPAEVDANFWECISRIIGLEENPIQPANIAAIDVDGNQMTITLTDATEFGPFTLPEAVFEFTDEFEGGKVYKMFDMFTAAQGMYFVVQPHTAASEFDPAASTVEGPLYKLIFPYPTHYDISFFLPGKVGLGYQPDKPLFALLCKRPFYIPEPSSEDEIGGGYLETPSADSLVIPIFKNGDQVAELSWSPSEGPGELTLDSEGPVQFLTDDRLRFINPFDSEIPDTTAEDLLVTILARRGMVP